MNREFQELRDWIEQETNEDVTATRRALVEKRLVEWSGTFRYDAPDDEPQPVWTLTERGRAFFDWYDGGGRSR